MAHPQQDTAAGHAQGSAGHLRWSTSRTLDSAGLRSAVLQQCMLLSCVALERRGSIADPPHLPQGHDLCPGTAPAS